MRKIKLTTVLLLAAFAVQVSAQTKTQPKPNPKVTSCTQFVQGFYDWYVHKLIGGEGEFIQALDRKDTFSPELVKALREDYEASQKNSDDIVGLDFDPFLNTQDPFEHYVVGKTTIKNDHCFANIHSVQKGRRNLKPDVVAELAEVTDHWEFVNFHYPEQTSPTDENLVSILKELKSSRETIQAK